MKGVPRIIAISGKYDTGKDTCVARICEAFDKHGIAWRHDKFANRLKQAAAIILGLPLEMMYTTEGKAYRADWMHLTVGQVQQQLGTECGRAMQKDIWSTPVIQTALAQPDHVVTIISDCRFQDEMDGVRKAGGIIIRINRKAANATAHGRDPTHKSETDLDDRVDFDLVVNNDGTIDEMIETVIRFLNKL